MILSEFNIENRYQQDCREGLDYGQFVIGPKINYPFQNVNRILRVLYVVARVIMLKYFGVMIQQIVLSCYLISILQNL